MSSLIINKSLLLNYFSEVCCYIHISFKISLTQIRHIFQFLINEDNHKLNIIILDLDNQNLYFGLNYINLFIRFILIYKHFFNNKILMVISENPNIVALTIILNSRINKLKTNFCLQPFSTVNAAKECLNFCRIIN